MKFLKKFYGEKFAHLCRSLFPTILDKEGELSRIISDNFAPTKSLYDDLMENQVAMNNFRANVYYQFDPKRNDLYDAGNKTVEQLFDEAGYILCPECKTQEEILSFKKYYTEDEELCTFRDQRLSTNRVFFAVKKDVENIKREDFKHPKREDEYSLSVISIQFTKGRGVNYVSIKSRYNHSVDNPDATLENNLDNIIPGLTKAFEKEYEMKISRVGNRMPWGLTNYVKAKNDGRSYRFNTEINGTFYCENNVIIDDFMVAKHYDKARYILIDTILLDKQEKRVDLSLFRYDGFGESLGEIDKITETVLGDNRVVRILSKNGMTSEVVLNSHNEAIRYKNHDIKEIPNNFFAYNTKIKEVDAPNVEKIGDFFLGNNTQLEKFDFTKVVSIGDSFLHMNNRVTALNLPNVENIGMYFMFCNTCINEIDFTKLRSVGDYFLARNTALNEISLPNIEFIGKSFMTDNNLIKRIEFPKVEDIKDFFMGSNNSVEYVHFPALRNMSYSFLETNKVLKEVTMENAQYISRRFLSAFDKEDCKNKELQISIPRNCCMVEPNKFVKKSIKCYYILRNLQRKEVSK